MTVKVYILYKYDISKKLEWWFNYINVNFYRQRKKIEKYQVIFYKVTMKKLKNQYFDHVFFYTKLTLTINS
jgi:hypothetical protein